MGVFLETERLIIQVPTENDLVNQYQLQSDPDVMQYIANGIRTYAEVEKVLRTTIEHYKKHGFSLGSVFEKSSGEFIGRAGLIYVAFDDAQPDIEVGYALLKPYWNKGYATELTKALIEWGFSHLSINKLVAVTRSENEKSRQVLQKSGMSFRKMSKYNGIDVTYYEIYRKFQFRELNLSDIPLITNWFNMPHVKQFYSLRDWSEEEVLKKLQPYILGEKSVYPFMVLASNVPIAYVQYYRVTDFPWPNQDLLESIIKDGAGMDLFIGKPEFLGKGYGHQIIRQFLNEIIWPIFSYCVVDPDIKNTIAIKCYKKLGFKEHKIIESENALYEKVSLNLMIKSK
jgi:RimJ/RimL family protein N-acetyltransferase